jgi:RNA polymerase sigma factor (sigma-70 family)
MATTIPTRTGRPWKGSTAAGLALRTQPDPRLALLCHQGSEAAFEEIVRRYRAPLLAYAATISPQRADDVTQEALTKAFLGLKRGQINELRPWLYTVVRNTALDDLQANRRIHEQLDESYDGVEQPPQAIERRQQLAAIVAGLMDLPERQREAIVKHELEGLEHKQIAGDLGVSVGAVKQLIHRGRRRLRDLAGLLLPASLIRTLAASGSDLNSGGAVGGGGAGAGLLVKGGATVAVIAATAGGVLHDQSASHLSSARQSLAGTAVASERAHAVPPNAAVGDTGTGSRSADQGVAPGHSGQSHGKAQASHGSTHGAAGLNIAKSHKQPSHGGSASPGGQHPEAPQSSAAPKSQPPPGGQHHPSGGGGGSGGSQQPPSGGGSQQQPPGGTGTQSGTGGSGSYSSPPPSGGGGSSYQTGDLSGGGGWQPDSQLGGLNPLPQP